MGIQLVGGASILAGGIQEPDHSRQKKDYSKTLRMSQMEVSRRVEVDRALQEFLYKDLRCLVLQFIADWRMEFEISGENLVCSIVSSSLLCFRGFCSIRHRLLPSCHRPLLRIVPQVALWGSRGSQNYRNIIVPNIESQFDSDSSGVFTFRSGGEPRCPFTGCRNEAQKYLLLDFLLFP